MALAVARGLPIDTIFVLGPNQPAGHQGRMIVKSNRSLKHHQRSMPTNVPRYADIMHAWNHVPYLMFTLGISRCLRADLYCAVAMVEPWLTLPNKGVC